MASESNEEVNGVYQKIGHPCKILENLHAYSQGIVDMLDTKIHIRKYREFSIGNSQVFGPYSMTAPHEGKFLLVQTFSKNQADLICNSQLK